MYILRIPKSIILLGFVASLPLPWPKDGKEGRGLAPVVGNYQLTNSQSLKLSGKSEDSDDHGKSVIPQLQAQDVLALSTVPIPATAALDPVSVPLYVPLAVPPPEEIATLQIVSTPYAVPPSSPNANQPSKQSTLLTSPSVTTPTLADQSRSLSSTSSAPKVAEITPFSDVARIASTSPTDVETSMSILELQWETTSPTIDVMASSTEIASFYTSSTPTPISYESPSSATSLPNFASSSDEYSSQLQIQPDTFFLISCVFTCLIILVLIAYFSWKWKVQQHQHDQKDAHLFEESTTSRDQKDQVSHDAKRIEMTMNNQIQPQFVDLQFSLQPSVVFDQYPSVNNQRPDQLLAGNINELETMHNHHECSMTMNGHLSKIPSVNLHEELYSPVTLDHTSDLNLHMIKRYAYFGELYVNQAKTMQIAT